LKIRELAKVGTFAAIYTIARVIPLFPLVGAQTSFPASDILVPLYGVLLGPYVGFVSILLGTLISFALGKPVIFLGLDFLPASLAAYSIGQLIKGRKEYMLSTLAIPIALYGINPKASVLIPTPLGPIPYHYIHLTVFLLLLSPITRYLNLRKTSKKKLFLLVFVLSFFGTMTQHAIGSTLFLYVFGDMLQKIPPQVWPTIWQAAFYLYPIERVTMSLLAALLTTPILLLKNKVPLLRGLMESD
jgi:biotin transporter BioY